MSCNTVSETHPPEGFNSKTSRYFPLHLHNTTGNWTRNLKIWNICQINYEGFHEYWNTETRYRTYFCKNTKEKIKGGDADVWILLRFNFVSSLWYFHNVPITHPHFCRSYIRGGLTRSMILQIFSNSRRLQTGPAHFILRIKQPQNDNSSLRIRSPLFRCTLIAGPC